MREANQRSSDETALEAASPDTILQLLQGRLSDRVLRLIACACARLAWPARVDERSGRAVEVGEQVADGTAGSWELRRARERAKPVAEAAQTAVAAAELVWLRATIAEQPARLAALQAARRAKDIATLPLWTVAEPRNLWQAARQAVMLAQVTGHAEAAELIELVSDIVGNPFRPIQLDPTWLRWHDGCIELLSRSIYDGRRHHELPIVADALEEAGCDQADLLAHCRSDRPHAHGCWALDLLLAKR